MAKDPAFLFYPGDWLGGTMGFTFEEKGAYLELLIYQFNNGKFSKSQAKQVLSICSASVFEKVLQKFNSDGTFFWKERLLQEIERRQRFSESRRSNAKSSTYKKNEPLAYAEHMETETEIETETINRDKTTSSREEVSEIITHLNEIAGTSFQVTEAHAKHIRARLKEGMTVEDLKAINIVQTHNWKGTEWQKYLRPSTLYNSEKAGGYLSEAKRAMQTGIAPIKSGLSKIEERNARLQRSADELRQQARKQSMS